VCSLKIFLQYFCDFWKVGSQLGATWVWLGFQWSILVECDASPSQREEENGVTAASQRRSKQLLEQRTQHAQNCKQNCEQNC
jgi:hypothetical protein